MELADIAIGISIIIFGLYYWFTSTFDFWKSRGVAGPSPIPFFGNLYQLSCGKLSIAEYLKNEYDANRDEKLFGIFMGREPVLVLKDLDLIRDVLITDFSTFASRGPEVFDRVGGPLSQNLVNLEPAEWRPLRVKMTPIFTSAKLKKMFYLLLECGEHLEKQLEKLLLSNETIECRELSAKYTTDVIGTCAFGLKMNALDDENSEFRKLGRAVFASNWKNYIRSRIRDFTPWLYSLLGPLMIDWKITNFFINIMRDTMNYRKKNQIVKHDFVDLVMEWRDNPDKVPDIELTDGLMTAQLFIFFIAGFETSATAMSNILYELALNQTIQDKVRHDINDELAKNNGELTYDCIKSMKYLHMVFQESLRKYPPGFIFKRQSLEPYTFAGTKLTLPAGTRVFVPSFAVHRDPQIYPEPEVFDPERFTDEAIKARHPLSWMAFGIGPRNCIAARFANYQTKIGLIKILSRYKVEVCDKTQVPYIIEPHCFVLAPIHGLHVKVSKIN